MNDVSLLILIQLLLSHVLTDFVFQPGSWVREKRKLKYRSKFLFFHSAISGLLAYLFVQQWELWIFPLFIAVTHFFIDLWKLTHKKDNFKIFFLDQFFHLLILLLVWLYLIEGFDDFFPVIREFFSSISAMSILTGYLIVIFPVGFLIGKATKKWQNEIEISLEKSSLDEAGRYIGIFERILVLTFILTGNFSAIGFLIAAKSILRFNEKTESGARKQTEYVLIGTLMSFAVTIAIGLLIYQFAL